MTPPAARCGGSPSQKPNNRKNLLTLSPSERESRDAPRQPHSTRTSLDFGEKSMRLIPSRRIAAPQLLRRALPLAILATFAAHAADDTQKEPTELTPIVVTGTHKAGLSPTDSISPIDAYSGAQIDDQGTVDLTDSLTKITPALNTQRFPIADGTAFVRPVSLRDLSPDQTLVLVDGVRRHRSALVNLQLAPLGTVNQGAQAVDFSAIPANAIQRVEVLRDGASVLYGSDAIAGVVNVILKDAPQGATVSAQYG